MTEAQASTNIQWTMKLSDAALIVSALQEVAQSAESQANYLLSDAYAEKQRDEFVSREQAKPEGEPRKRRSSWPGLSAYDNRRIDEQRQRAARLRELVES